MRPVYLISKTPYPGVIHIPILSISFLTPKIDFADYEGIIITSKQSVAALHNYSVDWNRLKCIAVSESTAQSAREAGAKEIETGDGYGESIPNVLRAKERSGKWLYLRPKIIASDWIDTARYGGVEIDEAIVYETSCATELPKQILSKEGVLVFTSPSTIRCFLQIYEILPTHTIVVIGKTTQNALPPGILSHLSLTSSVASAVELACEIAMEG